MVYYLKKGILIVLEGLDRCGKTTQTQLLQEALNSKGFKTLKMNFPERSNTTGQLIDKILTRQQAKPSTRAMHLLFSANRWEEHDKITKLINDKTIVIVDRYIYSGFAYTQASDCTIDEKWTMNVDEGLLKPNVVIYLNGNVETMSGRQGYGEEITERMDFQEKVKQCYDIAKGKSNIEWDVINADDDKLIIHNKILEIVMKYIENN